MSTFRESQIKDAEGKMSSNDKKRLVRLLMETNFFCEDLKYVLRYSLPMRSLGELAALINVKGLPAASASKILEGYISPYDSTVAKRLGDAGVRPLFTGKTGLLESCP